VIVIKSFCDNRGGGNGYLAYVGEYGDTREQAKANMDAIIDSWEARGAKAERERIIKMLFERAIRHKPPQCVPDGKKKCPYPNAWEYSGCMAHWRDWMGVDE
jgi:hypothetical protein